ncbi:MAG: hypothetical protein ACJAUG_002000 [Halioglobus sp.]
MGLLAFADLLPGNLVYLYAGRNLAIDGLADVYTSASNTTVDDDPIDFDGIAIPLPSEQLNEIILADDEQVECDFEDPVVCSP